MRLDFDRLNRIATIAVVLAVGALGALVVRWYLDRPKWWDPVQHYMIHVGLKETTKMAALSVLGAAVIGILFGTLLTIDFKPSRALIRLYVEFWRGLPIVVTLLIIAYAVPRISLIENAIEFVHRRQLSLFEVGTVTLVLWGSAQVAEATRGAVQSIPREQHEAASALGFGWVGRHWFVILPQAVRRLTPPMIGLLANVVQNTTIIGIIGVTDVLAAGNQSTERLLFSTGDPHAIAILLFVAMLFFAISFPLTRLAAFLERRIV